MRSLISRGLGGLVFVAGLAPNLLSAQTKLLAPVKPLLANAERLEAVADSAYRAKSYAFAATTYRQLGQQARFASGRGTPYYNAACCQALAGQPTAALQTLKAAVQAGYANAKQLLADEDLISLRATADFQKLVKQAQAQQAAVPIDPAKAQLVTSDIGLFWRAYDHAQREPTRAVEIYDREYFDKGSVGLQDYYSLKIKDTKLFVENQQAKPLFYRAIRPNTQRVAAQTTQIRAGFRKLKELYPEAVFPSVYFVIGRWNSGGTASDHGMLLGTDQNCATADTPRGELSLWERNGLGALDNLPAVVAHEQIHYLQRKGSAPTLLRGAIDEGMADFLAELTAGRQPNTRLLPYGLAHEKQIWADFQKEMLGTSWKNWIANATQETVDKPADLGYFVGYRICQSYYAEMADKKQAVHDILTIADYPAFLAKSRYVEKLAVR